MHEEELLWLRGKWPHQASIRKEIGIARREVFLVEFFKGPSNGQALIRVWYMTKGQI
jgi:hypothetical protein